VTQGWEPSERKRILVSNKTTGLAQWFCALWTNAFNKVPELEIFNNQLHVHYNLFSLSDSLHRNLVSLYVMHCELSAEDDKPSPHLLEILVSHNTQHSQYEDANIWCDVWHGQGSRERYYCWAQKGFFYKLRQDATGNAAVLIEQEVNVAGGECLKVFLLDIV
jgi:hypothetical protein